MEPTTDKVSVVIPSYNRSELLKAAIASLKSQTYRNMEIIIVDDCSTDNTPLVVKEMNDTRITYIQHEKNKGGAEARNTGIRHATGKYISFLDSDDQWLPEKLSLQMQVFQNNPEAGVVYTGVKVVDNERMIREIIPENKGDILKFLIKSNCIDTTSSVMVKKDLLDRIGGFDPDIPSCQDWDLYLRLAQITEFDFVRESLVLFYQHPGERITTDKLARLNGHLHIFNKFKDLAKRQGNDIFMKFILNIWKNIFLNGVINQHTASVQISRDILKEGVAVAGISLRMLFYYSSTFINLKILRFLYKAFKKVNADKKRLLRPVPNSVPQS